MSNRLESHEGAQPEVAPVEILPPTVLFDDRIEVVLQTRTADARIHYTLDGTEPRRDSPTYTGPILLRRTTTVRATAYKDGWASSAPTQRTYSRVNGLQAET